MKQQNKALYWLFKCLGIAVSCALPLWGICEKFPIWVTTNGTVGSIGTGGLLGFIVLLIVFRRTIFNFLKDKWKLKYAPPITIWLVMIAISYTLMFINKFLYDINVVFWMGFVGCALGGVLTFIGENFFGGKKDE